MTDTRDREPTPAVSRARTRRRWAVGLGLGLVLAGLVAAAQLALPHAGRRVLVAQLHALTGRDAAPG